jgi:hypothetical protein
MEVLFLFLKNNKESLDKLHKDKRVTECVSDFASHLLDGKRTIQSERDVELCDCLFELGIKAGVDVRCVLKEGTNQLICYLNKKLCTSS